jgi:hypothetical protein
MREKFQGDGGVRRAWGRLLWGMVETSVGEKIIYTMRFGALFIAYSLCASRL